MKQKYLVFVFLFVLFVSGCETVTHQTVFVEDEKIAVKNFCDRHGLSWRWDSLSQVLTVRRGSGDLKGVLDSNILLVGNRVVFLSRPLEIVDGIITAPQDFRQYALYGAGEEKEGGFALSNVRKIIIDAGHGGKDPGAIGVTRTREKDIVLDVALKLKRILEECGFETVLTRDSDHFISLQERTELAAAAKADLFISVHANASESRRPYGIEVFFLKAPGMLERYEDQLKENQEILFRAMNMRKENHHLKAIVSDMLGDHKYRASPLLADSVVRELSKYASAKNRGTKDARFFVLRNTFIPAVLVEVGFLSNRREERLLQTDAYRQKIARGIAEGILVYASK